MLGDAGHGRNVALALLPLPRHAAGIDVGRAVRPAPLLLGCALTVCRHDRKRWATKVPRIHCVGVR